MNKNRELVKNTLIISIGKICTQFISFFLLPLYTSLLSTEEYGTVDVITTYVQLLLPIVGLQIDQGVFRYLVDNRNNSESMKSLITSSLVLSTIQIAVFSAAIYSINLILPIRFINYLYLNVVATLISSILLQITRGLGDNTCYSIASFLTGFTTIVLNVLFIWFFRMKAEGMMLATFIANLLCSVFIIIRKKIYMYFRLRSFSKVYTKEMVIYSTPLILNSVSWWVVNASDRSIVLHSLGLASNGILAAAHKFPTIISSIFNIFNLSWTESAALHLKESDSLEFFSGVLDVSYRIFVSSCMGMTALMPFVFRILVNESFYEAYYLIPIYLIASFFNVLAAIYGAIYTSRKQTKEIANTSIIAGIVNIIVHLILIKKIGLYAASVSTTVAYLFMFIYRFINTRKYIKPTIDYQVVLSSIFVYIIVVMTYYLKIEIIQGIVLLAVVVYTVIINKKSIVLIINIIKGRFQKKGN